MSCLFSAGFLYYFVAIPTNEQKLAAISKRLSLNANLPLLEQVGDLSLGGQFIANQVRIDLRTPAGILGGQHDIVRADLLPEVCRHPWFLLPIHQSRGQPGLACQEGSVLQGLFGWLIVQVRIDYLEEAGSAFHAGFREIQKDHRLAVSRRDRGADHGIVVWIARAQHGQERVGETLRQRGDHDRHVSSSSNEVYVGKEYTHQRHRTAKGRSQRFGDQADEPGQNDQQRGEDSYTIDDGKIVLYITGTAFLLVNLGATVQRAGAWTPNLAHLLLAYLWMAVPALVAPVVVGLTGHLPTARIEAAAVAGLVAGWILQVVIGAFPLRLCGEKPCGGRDGWWLSVGLLNSGVLALWIAPFLPAAPVSLAETFSFLGYALILLGWLPPLLTVLVRLLSPRTPSRAR